MRHGSLRTTLVGLPFVLAGCSLNISPIQTGNTTSGGTQDTRATNNGGGTNSSDSTSGGSTVNPADAGTAVLPAPTGCLSTYHVAANGSNDNPGTEQSPFRDLQVAADRVNAGDCVLVHPGTYSGFMLRTTGAAGKPIVFSADPGAIINAPNDTTADGINIEKPNSRVDYVTIQGFTVQGNAGSTLIRHCIRAVTGDHIIIRHNETYGGDIAQIFTSHEDNLLIELNKSHDCANEHGIYVSNACVNPTVRGNQSYNNFGCGIHFNGDKSQGGNGIITGALVENNIIHDNGNNGGGSAINMDGAQSGVIRNNLLYNNYASGISLYQTDAADGARDNLVENNTIIMGSTSRWAVNISSSPGCVVRNNILFNKNSAHGAIEIAASPDPSLTGFVSDYNLLMNKMSTDSGDSTMTVAAWQTATGQDKDSKLIPSVSALFTSYAGNIFTLAAGSLAIDAGSSTDAPSTDLTGLARPQGAGIDIGAYEYQP